MKDALFLTGAAARISQEVALVDQLIENYGLEIDPGKTMLAGFSSGALNIAAINACFRPENAISWDKVFKEEFLFKIETSKVYKKNKRIPLDTSPLRLTIEDFLKEANMNSLQDFPFQSYILSFSFRRLNTVWLSNVFNRHQHIKLSDLLMATTAIPILFPDKAIQNKDNTRNKYAKGKFGDGGIGGSFRRFEYHLKRYIRQYGRLDNIYIISPMREVTDSDYEELNKIIPAIELFKMEIKDLRLIKVFLEMISQNGFDTFIKRFHKWNKKKNIANEIYVCIPHMEKNYPILNFNKQKEQYDAVREWASHHPDKLAIPLDEYVQQFEKKPLRIITDRIQRNLKHRIRSIRMS